MICAPDGGIIDDLIVYRLGEESFLVVANAGNAAVVSDALAERLDGFAAVLDDRSLATGLVAIQGPRSREALAPLTDVDLGALRYYAIAEGPWRGSRPSSPGPATRARTASRSSSTRPGRASCGTPCSRRPAPTTACRSAWARATRCASRPGMPLYGNELDRTTTPYDAGLGRVVKLGKAGDFVGRAALEKVARDGATRRLVGLVVEGRGIARHGYPVHVGDRATGVVTSGTQSPTLGVPIAMAYVAPGDGEPGTVVDVEIRDARVPARVVDLPFYRRPG